MLYGDLTTPKGYINLPIQEDFSTELKEIVNNTLLRLIEAQHNIRPYNPIGADNDVIEKFDINDNNFIDSQSDGEYIMDNVLSSSYSLNNINNKELNLYDYSIIKVIINSENIYLLRKPSKPKAVKKGNIITEQRGYYGKVDIKNFFLFDDSIDMVIHKNIFYVINNRSLELSLDLVKSFTQIVDEVFDNSEIRTKIIGYQKFVSDIKANKSYIRRIAKLKNSQTKFLFLKEIDKAKKINDEFDLGLNFKEEQIEYTDKSQTSHIIAFMQDAYYKTLLGDEKGKDLGR